MIVIVIIIQVVTALDKNCSVNYSVKGKVETIKISINTIMNVSVDPIPSDDEKKCYKPVNETDIDTDADGIVDRSVLFTQNFY